MRRSSMLTLLILTGSFLPRLVFAAWPGDPTLSVPVCQATGLQSNPVTTSDGANGILVAWVDQRSDAGDIYVQHINAAGNVQSGWPADGLGACVTTGTQNAVQILGDGAGGAFVAWIDTRNGNADVYAQHVTGAGTIAAGWPANGLALSLLANDEFGIRLCTDGAGGMYAAWQRIFNVSDYDVLLTRVSAAGILAAGFPTFVDNSGGIQDAADLAADGAGGALVAYEDNLSGNYDIRLKRISSSATVLASYLTGGSGNQVGPKVIADGYSGALLAFTEQALAPSVVNLVRVNASGAAVWFQTPLSDGSNQLSLHAIASDGSHGAYVVGSYQFLGFYFLRLIRVAATGAIASGWTQGGLALGTASGPPKGFIPDLHGGVLFAATSPLSVNRIGSGGAPTLGWPSVPGGLPVTAAAYTSDGTIADDGAGGVIAAWSDNRNGLDYNIYAERIDRFGTYGDAAPKIAAVRDVPNDQGGQVRVSWNPSYLDVDPTFGVNSYRVWRQVPAGPALAAAQARLMRGSPLSSGPSPDGSIDNVRVTTLDASVYYWELVTTTLANGQPGYSYVASTGGDSVAAGNPRTLFMLEAVAYNGTYWDSPPDSGYSVDNLPPFAPAQFVAAYGGASTHLSWSPSAETDFASYRLYRGLTQNFVPDGASLLSDQPDTGYVASPGSYYYKLVAVDAHGNVSPVTLVSPTGQVSVDSPAPIALAFERASANPTHSQATFRLSLPSAARATINVFDASGRIVSTLAASEFAAGTHTVSWDGRDAQGKDARAGLYFVRLVTPGLERTLRITRL